ARVERKTAMRRDVPSLRRSSEREVEAGCGLYLSPLAGRALGAARGLHLFALAALAGRGRRALARRLRGSFHESELVERPPLPASGERETRWRAKRGCPVPQKGKEPGDVCGTFVPNPSSRNLPRRSFLGVLEHHAHGGEFVAYAVGLGEVLGLAGG